MDMMAYQHNNKISSKETHFLKTKLVLTWLLEFRVSNVDVLSKRLNLLPVNTSRFFQNLIKKEFIQKFRNNHAAHNQHYLMLTPTGRNHLQDVCGVDATNARTSVSSFKHNTQLQHNINVQKFVLSEMDDFGEVVCSHNIDMQDTKNRPDALIKHRNPEYWVAVEYEHWRKNKKRIYHAVTNHVDAIQAKKWMGVYYVFREKTDFRYYYNLLQADLWPRYHLNRNTGVIKAMQKPFDVATIPNVRQMFKMRLLA